MAEEFQPERLISCTTIIYGPTKSGKTTLIIDLLKRLRSYIPFCYIVSGSEDVNPQYSKYVYKDFICRDVQKIPQVTNMIWETQGKQTQVYNRVHDIHQLKQTCAFLPLDQKKLVNEELKVVPKDDKKQVKQIYRKYINSNRELLMQSENSRVAEIARYVNINPRILLIFDDCIASGHKVINQSIQQIAFEGRHRHITFFLATQQETYINKGLRENAHYSIFCSDIIGCSVVAKMGLGQAGKRLQQVIQDIFLRSQNKESKAVFTGAGDGQILGYRVSIHDKFIFGCDAVIRLYKLLDEQEKELKKKEREF